MIIKMTPWKIRLEEGESLGMWYRKIKNSCWSNAKAIFFDVEEDLHLFITLFQLLSHSLRSFGNGHYEWHCQWNQ